MEFLFFTAANTPLFARSDAEKAEWIVQEYQLSTLWPYDPDKVITRGMRIMFVDPDGVKQPFEVIRVKNYEPDHYQEVTAEHIAVAELTDEHFTQTDITDKTAAEALATILTGTLWSVGNNTASGTSSANIGMGNVWADVRTIESNWNVYITPRVTFGANGITGRYLDIAPAGGTFTGIRLSIDKNMDETGITYDDSNVKTAAYGYGKSTTVNNVSTPLTFADVVWTATADHPAKPDGQTYLEDTAATAAYGRNGRARFGFYQNANISDAEVLLEKTWEWLQTVNKPQVSISCMVADLKRLGYVDEPIRLHGIAEVDIEPIGTTVRLEIIQLTVDLLDASQTRPTIGSYIPNIVYIDRETDKKAGGGGGGGGQTNKEYKLSEFETEIAANEYQISLRAYQRDMNNVDSILRQAGMSLNAQGVLVYADDNVNMWLSRLNVQADRIGLVVQGSGANASIKAAEIVASINSAGSTVKISADHIVLDGEAVASSLYGEAVGVGSLNCSGNITCDGTVNPDSVVANSISTDYLTLTNLTLDVTDLGGVVASFGTPTESGGQISIPWTKLNGNAGTPINFNIAATQYYIDGVAAARTTGQNSVTIIKGSWASGQITFSKSAGTASSKYVYLAAGTASWGSGADANKATVNIYDVYGGNSDPTGISVVVDASSRYTAGAASVGFDDLGTWSSGSRTITLTNGVTDTVSIPATGSWSQSKPSANRYSYTCTVGGRTLYHYEDITWSISRNASGETVTIEIGNLTYTHFFAD